MTQHPDDLAERGRHIFEALRRVAEHSDEHPHPDDAAADAPADVPSEPTHGSNEDGASIEVEPPPSVTVAAPVQPWSVPEAVDPGASPDQHAEPHGEPFPVSEEPATTLADAPDAPFGSDDAHPSGDAGATADVEGKAAAEEDRATPAYGVAAAAEGLAAPSAPLPVGPETAPEPESEPEPVAEPELEAQPMSETAHESVPHEPAPDEAVPEDPVPVLAPIGEEPVSELTLPRIIAIANQKGGVGKTTTSVNLGAALAELGFRVLVIDLDPQGNATTGLGVNVRNLDASIYDVIMNDIAMDDCIEPTSVRNLFVAPATIDLAGAEIELVPAFSRELKLRRALHEVRDDYDFTIIDCPPSLGLLTVNGLAAADDVIVPIQCEYYALEGLGQLLKNVALVRTNLNPALEVRGIVLTMYDARTKLSEAVAGDVRQHFGAKVYRNIVPRTVRLSEAPSFGQPITVFDPSSRGAIAYRELAKEVSRGATRRAG